VLLHSDVKVDKIINDIVEFHLFHHPLHLASSMDYVFACKQTSKQLRN